MSQPNAQPSPSASPSRWLYVALLVLFGLTQWPILAWVNRIEPSFLGLPFLYVYLFVIYLLAIGLLILVAWRGT
jgi:hypothetical protein